jgi:phosphoenolpyruvate carboxykinase (ATP)
VNTGWTGGPYGTGTRMKISHTRAMLRAALAGALDDAAFERDAVFGFEVPKAVPGVPEQLLRPRDTWADPAAYDARLRELARMFNDNFEKYASGVAPDVVAAAPRAAK